MSDINYRANLDTLIKRYGDEAAGVLTAGYMETLADKASVKDDTLFTIITEAFTYGYAMGVNRE